MAVYFAPFLRHQQLAHLMASKIYPNTKEVTETVGAYKAVVNSLPVGFSRNSCNVVCYVVGDGVHPRTAAYIAAMSKWVVYSIDPVVSSRVLDKYITKSGGVYCKWRSRLHVRSMKAEEFDEFVETPTQLCTIRCSNARVGNLNTESTSPDCVDDTDDHDSSILSIIVAVHSHADFDAFWHRVPGKKMGVAIPCCFKQIVTTRTRMDDLPQPKLTLQPGCISVVSCQVVDNASCTIVRDHGGIEQCTSGHIHVEVPPVCDYDDVNILSPARRICVWKHGVS